MVEQAYIAEALQKEMSTQVAADLQSATLFGYVLGPICGLLLTQISPVPEAVGYFQAILCFLMIFSVVSGFEEVPQVYRR